MNKKLGIGLLLVGILVGTILGVYVQAQSGSGTFTISQGVYPGATSYTIYQEGSTYYAKNDYGEIDYYGTDFALLFQAVHDNIDEGGSILIKNEMTPYPVYHQINITKSIHIKGEGVNFGGTEEGKYGTSLKLATSTTSNIYIFQINQTWPHLYFGSIKDLTLHGNRASNTNSRCLYIHGQTSDWFFENVFFREGGLGGVYLSATGDSDLWNIWFTKCLIENNDGAGIEMHAPSTYELERVHIIESHFHDNWDDIVTSGTANKVHDIIIRGSTYEVTDRHGINLVEGQRISIIGNHILDAGSATVNTYDSIRVENANNVTIMGNVIGNYDSSNTRYGINLNGTCSDVKVAFNTIGECVSGEIHVGPNVGRTNIQGNDDEWISPYVQYLPLAYRVDQQGLIYYEDPYIICRIHTEVNHTISWLAFGKTFGYGTYEWKAKVSGMEQDDSSFYMGLEKRHGWAMEGIIAVRYEPAAARYELYTSDGANAESTEITGVTFTNENTFKILWNSSHVLLYVNDVLKVTHTTYTPSGQMQLFGEAITYASAPSSEVYLYFRNRSFREVDT